MADPVIEQTAQADYLSMSDADIMNMSAPPVMAAAAAVVTPEPTTIAEDGVVDEGSATAGTEADEGAAGTAADESGAGAEDGQGGEKVAGEVTPPEPTDAGKEAPAPEDTTKAPEAGVVDFEAEYKKLLAPFKANGRDITVSSVDEAVVLMQMGANYNKKMAALKPNLKLMKLLENNGLLSEEKISFLVELDKKSPDAINKLVKDSGLDPMDFDAAKAGEYQPKIHKVDDREMDLDTVLDEIQETPTYTRTLEVVSKQWDGASKQVVANSPQLLKVINDHVARGIYDIISAEVERERVFGRLTGLSDIEAYRQVGDVIQARGGFNHLGSSQGKTNAPAVVVTPKPAKVEDDKLKDKRRAASSTKPATPAPAANKDFNPLALSDAEFAKLADPRFR